MAMEVHLDIVSAEREIFSGLVEMVFAPAIMGEVGIMPRHAPLITRLKPGEVRVRLPNSGEESFYVSGGILEIQPHVITVLSDTALRAHDIDEASALAAKEQAEQAMNNHTSEMEYAATEASLAEASARLAEASAQLALLSRIRKTQSIK
uniref:ATP synthase epsilon chain n=2 Tax=unclassified Candidatus Kentrum TaxID=2643149 RepID=A0A451ASI2_9GAMM|nr:MAG: ATP synthase F1 subcomplex epsilon subunit [Candidatus Kentron sp. LPFa]VFK23689.1 MAG: ATP synthase F1 subcomplex epsilon subunit [Candidatus Kentron sp. LPFa]VFK59058.1 MAG: ATP synthase F1 subcomplex epsilon subunit [Candidatus Kentron sp. UNK]VFK68999.1 MAG: ATP synthase F1 subcomplex epsilon subunit [Candidatus Kentron sp. UNK]